MKIRSFIVTACIFALAIPLAVFAESSSSNFILWGTAESGSGERSTSSSFINFGSTADISGLQSESTNFVLDAGFEGIWETPSLTMSISNTSITLTPNPLSTGVVSTGQSTLTVSTNADFGYSVTVARRDRFQNHAGAPIADVVDGAVTAGSEEFGVGLAGTDRAFTDDRAVTTTPRVVATRTDWIDGSVTTVTFKAAISPATDAGSYKGTVAFIASGNF